MKEISGVALAEQFRRLERLARRNSRHSHDDLHRCQQALRHLQRQEGVSQRQLADAMGLRPQSLGALLGKMAGDGALERRENPRDRRQLLLYLSDGGRLLLEQGGPERSARLERFYACLTPAERASLSAILDKLIAANEEDEPHETD